LKYRVNIGHKYDKAKESPCFLFYLFYPRYYLSQ